MKKPVLILAVALAGFAVASASAAGGLSPGTYLTKVSGATPAVLNGTWRLVFKGKGFSITRNGQAAVAGLAKIAGTKVTFIDVSGRYRCTAAQAAGTYTWFQRGSSLTLRVVRDACSGRKAILTNGFYQA